jgi:hypothetical protein
MKHTTMVADRPVGDSRLTDGASPPGRGGIGQNSIQPNDISPVLCREIRSGAGTGNRKN